MTTTTNATAERIGGPEPRSGVNAELLSVQAVAAMLGCSARHIWRMSDGGKMPRPVKLGALCRWRRASILEWLDAGCPSCRKGGAR